MNTESKRKEFFHSFRSLGQNFFVYNQQQSKKKIKEEKNRIFQRQTYDGIAMSQLVDDVI